MHSATKYLNGHSDVVAGALALRARDALWARIRKMRRQLGSALGPFEAWLLMRGMRTLDVRVAAQAKTRGYARAAVSTDIRPLSGALSGPADTIPATTSPCAR